MKYNNLKLPDFSTIIIVNKNQGDSKSITIKTKHIQRLRHYAFTAAAVLLVLIGVIAYLTSKSNGQELEKQKLTAQLAQLKGNIQQQKTDPRVSSGKAAQSYIQSIQAKLQKINDYLSKRGLKGFAIKGVGGTGNSGDKLSAEEQYGLYNEYVARLLTNVALIPMGYPRPPSITSVFGFRSDPFNTAHAEYHPGIDFQGQKGDPVKCTANGKVVFAGWYGGYGNCVRIQHTAELETLYGHMSKILVKVGQSVSVGDVVGAVGSTGHSTGTHLHYEVRKNGTPINPVNFLTLK